jgi:hypothetical protein
MLFMYDDEIRRIFKEKEEKETSRKKKFGNVKSIIHTNASGRKFVAVGDIVYHSDNWVTFIDFLSDYMMYVFGKDWFDSEVIKPEEDQHPVMQWRRSFYRFHEKQEKGTEEVYSATPSGPIKAYFTLAYDLYLVHHNSKLQELHVNRLKDLDQFQGARYELFATTSMIRAGYNIEIENEQDGSKKHVEFIAVHRDTGERVAIEAKSRHRSGILGFPGKKIEPSKVKLRIERLINRAIEKHPDLPYLIFVDINLYPENIEWLMKDSSLKELTKTLRTVEEDSGGNDYFNAIFYTNEPYHLGDDFSPNFDSHLSAAISQKPKFSLRSPKAIESIQLAILQRKNIPNEFEEG